MNGDTRTIPFSTKLILRTIIIIYFKYWKTRIETPSDSSNSKKKIIQFVWFCKLSAQRNIHNSHSFSVVCCRSLFAFCCLNIIDSFLVYRRFTIYYYYYYYFSTSFIFSSNSWFSFSLLFFLHKSFFFGPYFPVYWTDR